MIIGHDGELTGVDPSPEMMEHAKQRLGVKTAIGTASNIPFEDSSFDYLTMGYALRHISDLNEAFAEFNRVLRPSNSSNTVRICILELTRPKSRLGRLLLKSYLRISLLLLRLICKMKPRTVELWKYYWDTIDNCVPPQKIMQALREAGFTDVHCNRTLGVFSEFTAAIIPQQNS